jgi:hypothetical protein
VSHTRCCDSTNHCSPQGLHCLLVARLIYPVTLTVLYTRNIMTAHAPVLGDILQK